MDTKMGGMEGFFRYRARLAALPVMILACALLSAGALGGTFTSSPVPQSYESAAAPNISFHVHNSDPALNISSVNITFPSQPGLIAGSDYTNASGTSIYNTSYFFIWNTSSSSGFLQNGTTAYFNLSFTGIRAPANYTFPVNATFTDGSYMIIDNYVLVEDSIAPSGIVPAAGNPPNSSWITYSPAWLNFTFTEINPGTCLLDLDNGTKSNYTMLNTSGSSCAYLAALPSGQWNYSVWVSDTQGNLAGNGTYYLGFDSASPVAETIELIYEGSNVAGQSITTRRNVTIKVNATDSTSGVYQALARIYNESGVNVFNVSLTSQSGFYQGVWDTISQYYGAGVYNVNITLNDTAGNYAANANSTTLDITGAPDLVITGADWTSSNANPGHPTQSDSLTLNVSVKNQGDENFTGTFNVTASVSESYLGGSEVFRVLMDNSSLYDGGTAWFNVTFPEGNFSSNSKHYITFTVDPANAINESLDTNNVYSFNISLGYNVSLVSVRNATQAFTGGSVPGVFPNKNLTYNISVRYANGDPVTGLSFTGNFSFTNTPPAQLPEDDSALDSRHAVNLMGAADGFYIFNYTAHGLYTDDNRTLADPGDHTLGITVSNGSYSGILSQPYNVTAPNLVVTIDIDDYSGWSDDLNVDFNLSLANTGNAPASGVFIDENDDWGFYSFIDYVYSDGDIGPTTINPGQTVIYPQGADDLRVRVAGTYTGSGKSLWVFVHYNDTAGTQYTGFDDDRFTVSAASTAPEEEEEGAGGAGGETLTLELTLIDWDDYMSGYPGDTLSTIAKAKNTGDVTVVAKASFSCPVAEAMTVTPISKSLAIGETQEFTIGFKIKADAEIGDYDCTVKAYVSSSESDYDQETLRVTVLATEEEKHSIEGSFINVSDSLDELLERFSLLNPALVNESNLTRIQNLLTNANSTLRQIREAIDNEDYASADELIEALQASLPNIQSVLEELEVQQTLGGGAAITNTWFWAVVIIVIVIAVAFVAYLLFPQQQGFGGPKRGPLQGIVGLIKRGDSGPRGLAKQGPTAGRAKPDFRPSPVKQVSGYSKPQGPGVLSRIKSKLRRKKQGKEITSYFSNPSSNLINYK